MPKYSTDAIRNLAILGAGGSGKTTFVEAMLHEAGEIGRAGRVEDGNTVCDFEDLEQEMRHSLDSALVHLDYEAAHFNILDTPGVADFLGRAFSVLPAIETCVIVIDASAGIETVTRRVMRAAADANRPRMILVNKIDNATGFGELLATIQETFGSECRPINLPANGGKAVIDCFQGKGGCVFALGFNDRCGGGNGRFLHPNHRHFRFSRGRRYGCHCGCRFLQLLRLCCWR